MTKEEDVSISVFTMRLETSLKKKIEARAKKNDRSLTKEIIAILRSAVMADEDNQTQ